MGVLKECIEHEEMNKDMMHNDDTVPVTVEQRHTLEVATAEKRKQIRTRTKKK